MTNDEPKSVSRRAFLKKTGQGAAVAGLAVAAPAILKGAGNLLIGEADGALPSVDPSQAVIAYVRDPFQGEVVVMMGSKEVVQINRGLARQILQVASG